MNLAPDELDGRAAADQEFAAARELASTGVDAAVDEAVELADRAITTYLEELGDVASAAQVLWFLGRLEDTRGRADVAAAQLRSAVEGFVVTHDDRAGDAADELVALLRRTGQDDRVEEFLTWQSWLVGTVTGEQDRTAAAGRRRAP
jgi:hypothetical protein